MRKSGLLLTAMLALAVAGGSAKVSAPLRYTAPPLFAAFQKFCADTKADPEAIAEAVEDWGGVYGPHPGGMTTKPLRMNVRIWNVTVEGHAMVADAGTQQDPESPRDREICDITSNDDEEASIPLLAKWAGVPTTAISSSTLALYNFTQDGRTHQPVAESDVAEKESWTLVIQRAPHFARASLQHGFGNMPGKP